MTCHICEDDREAPSRPGVYLDLESPLDRRKLADPTRYLDEHEDKLVVLDEVHRVPELFQTLHRLIDKGRRGGHKTGRFLLLGSASMDLLRQPGGKFGRPYCVP